MHSSNSSNKYLLSTHWLPGTVLGNGDTIRNKTDKKCLPSWSWILVGETINQYIKYVICQTVVLEGKIKQEAEREDMHAYLFHRVVVIKGRTPKQSELQR